MYENKTYENIKNEILHNIKNALAKNEGSFLSDLVSSTSLAHASYYSVLDKILNTAFIEGGYGEYLDKRAKEFGIYRKDGQCAVGRVHFYGQAGTQIPSITRLLCNGQSYYVLDNQDGIISRSGEEDNPDIDHVTLYIKAERGGVSGNQLGDVDMELETPIEGVTKVLVHNEGVKGGTDEETDEDFKARIIYLQSHRGTSGNVDDYMNWCYEIEGVKHVRVIPLWKGNGTVKVIVTGANNAHLDDRILEKVKEYISIKRPIGADVTIITPTVVPINIRATVEILDTSNIQQIKESLTEEINAFLLGSPEVTYTKIGGILSRIRGVIDYKDLTVNENTRNFTLTDEQVGTVGTIELNKGVVE